MALSPVSVALTLRVKKRVAAGDGLGLTLAELAMPDDEVPVTLRVANALGVSEELGEAIWAGVAPLLGVSVGLGVSF